MKKYILLLSMFVLFSCEDEKEEEEKEVSFWSGTYKLSAQSWRCNGDENIPVSYTHLTLPTNTPV